MSIARHPARQASHEEKTDVPSSATANGVLRQYRQCLLRELAEVERLIAEREEAVARKAVR